MDESDPETVRLTDELRNTLKKYCGKCKLLFKPISEHQDICHICVPVSTPVSREARLDDRKREASTSPERADDEPKRNKQESFDIIDHEGKRLSIYVDNLDKLDQRTMILSIQSLLGWVDKYKCLENQLEAKIAALTQELRVCKDQADFVNNVDCYQDAECINDVIDSLQSETMRTNINGLLLAYKKQKTEIQELVSANAKLEKDLVNTKLAFADNAFKILRNDENKSSSATALGRGKEDGKAILIAMANAPVDLNKMDSLLGSNQNGPVTQNIKQHNDKVVLTYSDVAARDMAKKILRTSKEGQQLFKNVVNSVQYFPVLIKFVNLEHSEEEILADLKYRNPILKEHAKSVKVIYRSREDPNEGHIKLWITSRAIRDEIIKRGEVYFPERRCRVIVPDINREVRRCYRCQQYGHIIKNCKERTDTCGKCAGAHRTNLCDKKVLKCSNCARRPQHLRTSSDGKHEAGDKICPEQVKALERYKKMYSL